MGKNEEKFVVIQECADTVITTTNVSPIAEVASRAETKPEDARDAE
jgi:hypothetical protein